MSTSLFGSITALAGEWNAKLKNEIAKYNNADFAEATMAVCALVGFADGSLSSQERIKTANAIQKNDLLKVFKFDTLKAKFDAYCDKLSDDYDMGSIDLLGVIGKIKKDTDQANAAIRIGILVASSDGNFDDSEKQVIVKLCKELKLDASDFGLA